MRLRELVGLFAFIMHVFLGAACRSARAGTGESSSSMHAVLRAGLNRRGDAERLVLANQVGDGRA